MARFTPEPGTYNFAKVLHSESEEIERLCEARQRKSQISLGSPGHFGVAFSGGGIRSACVALGMVQSLAKHRILMQAHYLSAISGGGYLLGWLTAWIKRDGAAEVEKRLATNTACDGSAPIAGKAAPAQPVVGGYDRFLEPEPIHHLRRYSSYLTPRMGLLSGDTLAMASIYLRNVLLNQVMLIAALLAVTLLLDLLSPEVLWAKRLSDGWLLGEEIALVACFFAGVTVAACALRQINSPVTNPRKWDWMPAAAYACGMAGCMLAWHISPTVFLLHPGNGMLLWVVGVLAGIGLVAGIIGSVATRTNTSAVNRSPIVTFFSVLCAWAAAGAFTLGADMGYRAWLRAGNTVYVGDLYAILGFPGVLLGFVLVSYLFIGILGEVLPDQVREWLARIFGYFLASAIVIAGLLAIVLDGPVLMEWMFDAIRQGGWRAAGTALLPGGWLFVVASGIVGGKSSKTGAASSNSQKKDSSSALDLVVRAAPPAFLIGLLLLVSWGTHKLVVLAGAVPQTAQAIDGVDYLSRYQRPPQPGSVHLALHTEVKEVRDGGGSSLQYEFSGDPAKHPDASLPVIHARNPPYPGGQPAPAKGGWWSSQRHSLQYALLFAAAVALAGILAWRVSVNEFSMHLFYRNRLVRAFLGASVKDRKPNWFTGFAGDDLELNHLASDSKLEGAERAYDGPYPVWGTTLNLTSGEDLAWQQRKGASFIYSPLFSGWDYVPEPLVEPEKPLADAEVTDGMLRYGYRTNVAGAPQAAPAAGKPPVPAAKKASAPDPEPGYGGDGGEPTIGTAMAASGAAASPNMGFHTSPGVAALLAIFNVRLGWWTGNPRHARTWKEYSPSAWYLLSELFGSASDRSKYVYLSDGGHFENLGIYELVRRRVRFIICSDADADEGFAFQDLGNAVERCRRDFGVEIEIHAQDELKLGTDPYRASHYAIGRINYLDGTPGILLYIKSSLTSDEPSDVLSIGSEHRKFPHDSTANQSFDEPLFEAYRALGQHMIDGVLALAGKNWTGDVGEPEAAKRVEELFGFLTDKYERSGKAPAPAAVNNTPAGTAVNP